MVRTKCCRKLLLNVAPLSVYIPVALTPSFRFGLTPLFRTFDPQNVNNIPEV